jgi:hypothetical protein
VNIEAWSNFTKRWAEAGNGKIVDQSISHKRHPCPGYSET